MTKPISKLRTLVVELTYDTNEHTEEYLLFQLSHAESLKSFNVIGDKNSQAYLNVEVKNNV